MSGAFVTAGQVRLVQRKWAGIDVSAHEGLDAGVRAMLALDVEALDAGVVLDGQSGAICTQQALFDGTMALLDLTRAPSSGAAAGSGEMQSPGVGGLTEQLAVGNSEESLAVGAVGASCGRC